MNMISEKLRKTRTKLGFKQSEVAERLGCAPTSLTHWENGKVNPPFEMLEKVCGVYGISPLDLLDHYPTMNEIHGILQKPISSRTYEESVALAFCGEITGWVSDETTPDEEEILRVYRRLDDSTKAIVIKIISAL